MRELATTEASVCQRGRTGQTKDDVGHYRGCYVSESTVKQSGHDAKQKADYPIEDRPYKGKNNCAQQRGRDEAGTL